MSWTLCDILSQPASESAFGWRPNEECQPRNQHERLRASVSSALKPSRCPFPLPPFFPPALLLSSNRSLLATAHRLDGPGAIRVGPRACRVRTHRERLQQNETHPSKPNVLTPPSTTELTRLCSQVALCARFHLVPPLRKSSLPPLRAVPKAHSSTTGLSSPRRRLWQREIPLLILHPRPTSRAQGLRRVVRRKARSRPRPCYRQGEREGEGRTRGRTGARTDPPYRPRHVVQSPFDRRREGTPGREGGLL